MKVLHTSDWHVGRTLHRVGRLGEAEAALREVAAVAVNESVDVVVVCGDVFEHLSPSAEAEQVVYEALVRFSQAGIPVVVIAGNHDHPGRWQAIGPLLNRFEVHVVDDLYPADRGGLIEVPSRDGRETLQVAAIPWVSERKLYDATDLMGGGEKTFQSYADGMSRVLHTMCEAFDPAKCNLLAAHLFVDRSIVSESERSLTIGEIYAVTPNAVPANVQYVALGHVHKPQTPPGFATRPCRYSGSLIQLDFGEVGQEKGVVVVELHPGLPASVREIPLTSGRRLRDVSGTLAELEALSGQPDDSYLRVTVTCDGPQPGLSDQVREILPNALVVKLSYPERAGRESLDIKTKAPRELFEMYLAGRYASPPETELLELFDRLMIQASGDGSAALRDEPAGQPAGPEGLADEPAPEVDPLGQGRLVEPEAAEMPV